MRVEILVSEEILGQILSDIASKRGGHILGIENVRAKFSDEIDMEKKIVRALLPLSEIVGYSKHLRMATKGEGSFVMHFSHFVRISREKQEQILEQSFFF